MRSGIRPRPHIDIAILIVRAKMFKRSRFSPGSNNQAMRFVEHLAGERRVNIERKILAADPSHEPRNYPPAGHDIEHGDFFCYPEWIRPQRKAIAENSNLGILSSPRQHTSNDIRRRH